MIHKFGKKPLSKRISCHFKQRGYFGIILEIFENIIVRNTRSDNSKFLVFSINTKGIEL